jgi:DNA-binding NtrC family response regulator
VGYGGVLIVDDDEIVTSLLSALLDSRNTRYRIAGTVAAAMNELATEHFDAVLLDVHLPDGDGLVVLDRALELAPPPIVLMITARAEIRGAVEAMRRGASDFLEKPLDLADLGMRLDRAEDNARVRKKLAIYEESAKEGGAAIAESAALREVNAVAARLASTPASSALILGESGVGKEVIANRIHELSDRRAAPFVRVNLAAIAESMIEAELFGSVRGAFTDSKRDRAGYFASAEGGTILLDEICEFKSELQPKLLRALEERRFFPVGSDRDRKMNVRVLAATNRDPEECIKKGTLRADLYYRLATITLRVPPLRDRRDDILPLAEHFLRRFRAEFGKARVTLGKDAREALVAYTWPGNVRELRNVIERTTMLAPGDEITDLDLGLPVDTSAAPPLGLEPGVEPMTLEDMERAHIVRVLANAGGSRTRAATLLGISRSTLWEKGKRYGLF